MNKKYKLGVVGRPIEHSLSPKLQNYWLNSNNIEAIYGKLQAYDNDSVSYTHLTLPTSVTV